MVSAGRPIQTSRPRADPPNGWFSPPGTREVAEVTTDGGDPLHGATPDGVRIVTLKGRLSALHSPTVAGMITEAMTGHPDGPRALVVDLSGVEVIDASIARTLRRALVGCERVGVRASLAGVE